MKIKQATPKNNLQRMGFSFNAGLVSALLVPNRAGAHIIQSSQAVAAIKYKRQKISGIKSYPKANLVIPIASGYRNEPVFIAALIPERSSVSLLKNQIVNKTNTVIRISNPMPYIFISTSHVTKKDTTSSDQTLALDVDPLLGEAQEVFFLDPPLDPR